MLSALVLLSRVVLIAVFALAGAAKLLDRDGSRDAMREFGVPAPVAGPLARVLPLTELGIAAFLLGSASARWAALAAALLLTTFASVLALALGRGRRPTCHCFGELSRGPAGPSTLIRTGLLAALAAGLFAALLTEPPHSLRASLAHLDPLAVAVTAGGLALALAVGFAAWFVTELLRQNGRILRRLEMVEDALGIVALAPTGAVAAPQLPVGAPAPAFRLARADGGEEGLTDLLDRGRPLVLVFADPNCGPCRALLPEISDLQHRYPASLTVAVVTSSPPEQARAWLMEVAIEHMLVTPNTELARLFGAAATPSAVAVGVDGRIASALVRGARAVRALIEQSATSSQSASPSEPPAFVQATPAVLVEAGGGRGH